MLKVMAGFIGLAFLSIPILEQTSNDTDQIAAVKAAVTKIGTGKDSVVQVTRRGMPKVKGYISAIYQDRFEVISTQNGSIGVEVTIWYEDVLKIKGKGIDWRSVGIKSGIIGLKAFKVMHTILKNTCLGPISRCSP